MQRCPYTYKPLPNQGSIRLLTVQLELTDEITCLLQTVDLRTEPTYYCLSYTWGDPYYWDEESLEAACGASHPCILCDDGEIEVTRNLYTVLKQFRQQRRPELKHMWIDAICIDQNNLDEQAHQVSMMGQIYSSAQSVLAWLGPQDAYTQPVLDTLYHLDRGLLSQVNKAVRIPGRSAREEKLSELALPRVSLENWYHCIAFFNRSWFRRVWIIQEVALAKSLTVFSGDVEMGWDELIELYETIYAAEIKYSLSLQPRPKHQQQNHTPRFLYSVRKSVQHIGRMPANSIEEFFIQFRRVGKSWKATNPRDFIFAVRGFSDLPFSISPDYKKSTEEVYTEFTWKLIESSGNLMFLAFVEDAAYKKFPQLPSWVPDYSVRNLWSTGLWRYLHPRKWRAGMWLEGLGPSLQGSHLVVSGTQVAKIVEVARHGFITFDRDRWARTMSLILNLRELYPTGEARADAFWKTLWSGSERIQAGNRYCELTNSGLLWSISREILCNKPQSLDPELALRPWKLLYESGLEHLVGESKINLIPRLDEILSLCEKCLGHANGSPITNQTIDELVNHASDLDIRGESGVCRGVQGSAIFRTETNLIGKGPESLEVGDSVWIFHKGAVPFVLRRNECGTYRFLGHAYIHGIMFGEYEASGDYAITRIELE